jgi:hypothetical protein
MKSDHVNAIAQDRPATWEEIRGATSFTPARVLEHCYTDGTHCEIDSEMGDIIRYRAEELEFFAYLSEKEDTPAN